MPDIVYLRPCPKHRTEYTETVAASDDPDRTMEVLLCMACWRKNPKNMADLLDSLGIFGSDREAVLAHRK